MTLKDDLQKNKNTALLICQKSLKSKKALTKQKEVSELKILSMLAATIIDENAIFLHQENIKILDIQLNQNEFLFHTGIKLFDKIKDSDIESHIKSVVFSMEEQLEATRIVYSNTVKQIEDKENNYQRRDSEDILFSFKDFEKEDSINIDKTKIKVLKSFLSELNDFKDLVKYSLPRSSWEK